MSGERHGSGIVVVWVLFMCAAFAYFALVIGPAQERCERSGGEPVVDEVFDVRCVAPSSGSGD